MKAYKESTSIDPLILNVNTWWELSSQLQALATLPEQPPPSGNQVGPKIQSQHFGEQKNLLPLAGIEP